MKKIFVVFMAVVATTTFTSCGGDNTHADPTMDPNDGFVTLNEA